MPGYYAPSWPMAAALAVDLALLRTRHSVYADADQAPGWRADLDASEEEPAVRRDEGVGLVHGDVAAPTEQRAVMQK